MFQYCFIPPVAIIALSGSLGLPLAREGGVRHTPLARSAGLLPRLLAGVWATWARGSLPSWRIAETTERRMDKQEHHYQKDLTAIIIDYKDLSAFYVIHIGNTIGIMIQSLAHN